MGGSGGHAGEECSPATDCMRQGLRKLDNRNLIESCLPEVQTTFRALVLTIAMLGMGRVRVTCGSRTLDEQARLYGQGRTAAECEAAGVDPSYAKPEKPIVTWIAPAESKHVQQTAIDVDVSKYAEENYNILGHAAVSLGVTWGGFWSVKDYGHFEL